VTLDDAIHRSVVAHVDRSGRRYVYSSDIAEADALAGREIAAAPIGRSTLAAIVLLHGGSPR
jgi:hypothetical protein